MTRPCISCGRPITRGDTGPSASNSRCLVCRVASDLAGWRYDPPASRRYRTDEYRAQQRARAAADRAGSRARSRAAYAARKARLWEATIARGGQT